MFGKNLPIQDKTSNYSQCRIHVILLLHSTSTVIALDANLQVGQQRSCLGYYETLLHRNWSYPSTRKRLVLEPSIRRHKCLKIYWKTVKIASHLELLKQSESFAKLSLKGLMYGYYYASAQQVVY